MKQELKDIDTKILRDIGFFLEGWLAAIAWLEIYEKKLAKNE